MATDSFSRADLQGLSEEIKNLSERTRTLITALVAVSVEQMRADLADPNVRIDVSKSEGVPLSALDQIFEDAFSPRARSAGAPAKKVGKVGKVGVTYQVDLDQSPA